jgi:Lrp/AsnC family leucine-responsive transcriptional regulator
MPDEIDVIILETLQKKGRTRRNDLAVEVGLSLPSVSERLRKLETGGAILGYHATLDPKKFGKMITAFIFVHTDSPKHYPSFVERATADDEIIECHAITGEGSHLLKVRTDSTASLEKLLAKIQSWQGVTGTRTNLVLSSSKETSFIKLNSIKNS